MATETVGERSPYHLVMTNIAMEAMALPARNLHLFQGFSMAM
jgi:hypothetical protein